MLYYLFLKISILLFKEFTITLFPVSILQVALLFNLQSLGYLIFLRKH